MIKKAKRYLIIGLSIVSLLSTSTVAFAETYSGGDDWHVDFTSNKKMESNFGNGFSDTLNLLQPGDKATFRVKVENSYKTDTDWYMTNKILKSLEDADNAAGSGAYTYLLTYTDPKGNKNELYNSEAVGGDVYQNKKTEGLFEATQALEDYFYLDRLKTGEKGYIDLTVLLDGETQGNYYQNTLAQLQMNFAVELPPEGEEPTNKIITTENRIRNTVEKFFKAGFVKTSDNANLNLLIKIAIVLAIIIAIALIIVGVICIRMRKKMKGAKDSEED